MIDDLLKQYDQIILAYDSNVRKGLLNVIKFNCKLTAWELREVMFGLPSPPRNPQGLEVITRPKYYKRRLWNKYLPNWTYRTDTGNDIVKGTIYVKKPYYKLVHLLEYGHVLKLKNGGTKMVRGFSHVAKAEKKMFEDTERDIAEALKKLI